MPVNWAEIEEKWLSRWQEAKVFEADPDPSKPKFFVTFPYPYVNGPLHVGHGFTATRADVIARYKRMCGYNALFPWAWHWTGEPIVGAAERIAKGDPQVIWAIKNIDGVPDEELKKFVDPVYMAQYYTRENRKTAERIGFSIDWRREFHTTKYHPHYSKFIEWQYRTLKKLGYVTIGTHPVVWCPRCESPTGDHDRLEGEGVSPEEYVLIKFPFGDAYLPAATFRPETIYGVTNLWINPDATYVEAEVDGEKWIISEEAAEKLKEQLKKVSVKRWLKGRELIGKKCKDPISGRELIILPAWFVDPKNGSGVVYSVPAHAPYDWLGLRDLIKNPDVLKEFGISPKEVEEIKPISIIEVEEFGEYPAIEIVEQMKVVDQKDPKAEEATKIIYKKEFHTGVLKQNCGPYAGESVRGVKQRIIDDFVRSGIADIMYDLPQPVICRCTTPCVVKIIADQWFLRYSDPEWKKRAHELIDSAKIYPEAARQWFHEVIDWLRDWACARKTGLGTPLPWSPDWIVETLSDSTVYMAFYTIAWAIKKHQISPEQLTDEVFDYVFRGEGDPSKVSEATGIPKKVLEEMRNEFLYWYPIDLRNSAKELVPNHLTFFVFQHTALFPKELWPRGIGVNGMVMIEGQKMSKSKGNFVTLRGAIETYGADATRAALLLGAQGMDDPDWRAKDVEEIKRRLEYLHRFVKDLASYEPVPEKTHMERWIINRLAQRVKDVTESLEQLKTRTAIEIALYEVWNDIRWYLRRAKRPDGETLRRVVDAWLRLLAPFIPYTCEELWEALDKPPFVSIAPWPKPEDFEVDPLADECEELVKSVIDDVQNIARATKTKPKRIYLYTAKPWKWDLYLEVVKRIEEGKNVGDLAKSFCEKLGMDKKEMPKLVKLVNRMAEAVRSTHPDIRKRRLSLGMVDECSMLEDAKEFLSKELGAEVQVFREGDPDAYDPKGRSELAQPYRPAIYLE